MSAEAPPEVIRRHSLPVRLWHWLNALCLLLLLMSGLQIFNAYPRLHWGQYGANADHAWLQLKDWPGWMTLPNYPNLADGRRWHFFFAWLFVLSGAAYALWTLISGHLGRDLAPNRADWRGFGRSVIDHIRLKHPTGDEAKRYNVLQKLAYLIALFVLLPLMLATGLTMSPGMNAAFPWMLDLFGGRPSARSLHFISAALIVAFVAVHLIEVVLAGPINEVRSMITGRYVVPREHDKP
jgi:thiosulfate reductase cytochrome b subunit